MTNEQLQAVTLQVSNKRKYLETKVQPGQPIPKWLKIEFEFANDHQLLAEALYNTSQREKKLKERCTRLGEVINLMESAFNQILHNRPALVSWTGKLEAVQARPLVFFHLARLMPERLSKLATLQFYHEYTNELITGRNTRPGDGTANPFSSPATSKPDS